MTSEIKHPVGPNSPVRTLCLGRYHPLFVVFQKMELFKNKQNTSKWNYEDSNWSPEGNIADEPWQDATVLSGLKKTQHKTVSKEL